jgi:diaminohydroxyphosphoribosylaminopyrimidine deaminase/5-amino-6-(5-phosphoribosylamino)uracil reductase
LEGRRGEAVALSPVDRIYLRRACELAVRGRGNTAPNPAVGAVIVRAGRTLGEGYHHRRGEPHAEAEALRSAGGDVRGATAYVSLEPCNHHGLTPPCSEALIDAGISRVVIGVADPNPRTAGGGIARLRAAGIAVELACDPWARAAVEAFSFAIACERPYVHLKLAVSLDGYVAPAPGAHWLTGEIARDHVRELRASYDAVLVGAGTVRSDDPLLTVRPPRSRLRPYVRVIACEDAPIPPDRRVLFDPRQGAGVTYARTLVLAPAGARAAFAALEASAAFAKPRASAELVYIGAPDARTLDLAAGLRELKARGIASVLCEGGPTLAARLLAQRLVDRLDWLVAPVLLANERAVPALRGADLSSAAHGWRFDCVEHLGDDLRLSALLETAG